MSEPDYQQNARDIIEFLDKVKTESPDNAMTMFFVQKPSREKYVSFRPQISDELQKKILSMILDPAIKSLGLTVVPYSAVGVADEENELLIPATVECLSKFMESVKDENLFTEMKQLDISKISFYCTKISYEDKSVYLFRQFSKMNKLRNSFMGQFVDDALREMDSDFLGIDALTDIVYDPDYEIVIVLNHISLERIFNYRDEFLKITNAAIGEIVDKGIMENVEQFSEDCRRDVRILKRFTDMMSKERLPLFFEHYEKVPDIVKELELDIDFDDEGKIIYRERSQLFHIINLMSDAYFESLLAGRRGVVKTEDSL
jgi:hypothetical protein